MQTRLFASVFALILALAVAPSGAQATLLEYWDFNNDSRVISGSTLGIFSTDGTGVTNATGNGEIYNTTTKTLSSNSSAALGAVFTNGSLSLSGALGTYGGATNATPSWGVYTNSSGATSVTNLPAADATTGGSLALVVSGASTESLVFSLSSTGYTGLALSSAQRLSTAGIATITWAYSLNDSTWVTLTGPGAGGGNFAQESLSLPTALDNLSTFYVQETIAFNTGGSFAIDNVQLNGTALAVPEPATYVLLAFGGGVLLWRLRRLRAAGIAG